MFGVFLYVWVGFYFSLSVFSGVAAVLACMVSTFLFVGFWFPDSCFFVVVAVVVLIFFFLCNILDTAGPKTNQKSLEKLCP